jgi:hypothetical protein
MISSDQTDNAVARRSMVLELQWISRTWRRALTTSQRQSTSSSSKRTKASGSFLYYAHKHKHWSKSCIHNLLTATAIDRAFYRRLRLEYVTDFLASTVTW